MADSVYQSTNTDPTITYTTPGGQSLTGPLSKAPPQVQLMYQQLPQAQAQTSTAQSGAVSAQAGAQVAQVEAQKAPAQINLGADLAGKMTLDDALKKYTPLGKTPDEIFNQYLASSPYGLPKESPQDLMNKGISATALGAIGTPGSFMDRFNTKNAIAGLRDLRGKWQGVSDTAKLPFLGSSTDKSQGYEAGRTILGNHLSSLIPGASGAQATGQSLLDTLPNVGDASQLIPGASEQKFNSVEDQLLATKGYSYKDLGLSEPAKQTTGGGLLSSILGNAGKEISNVVNPFEALKVKTADSEQQKQDKLKQLTNMLVDQSQSMGPAGIIKNTLEQYLGIAQDPKKAFTEKPISTTLAVLGPLLGIKGAMGKSTGVEAGAESTATTAGLSGNPIMDFLNPKGVVKRGGNVRNAVVDSSTKAGNTVSGDSIVSQLEKTAPTLKRGNLGQGDVIDQSIADATQAFGGVKLTPQELASAYKEADAGFTKAGTPKTSIQSNIDRNLRDILGKQLEGVAPGWNEATSTMAKGYKASKSPVRPFVARTGAAALGIAGLDQIRHILGL